MSESIYDAMHGETPNYGTLRFNCIYGPHRDFGIGSQLLLGKAVLFPDVSQIFDLKSALLHSVGRGVVATAPLYNEICIIMQEYAKSRKNMQLCATRLRARYFLLIYS